MSDEKKLSFEDAKSAIESCYGFDDATTPVGEAWAIVNDKIAALEQRLAAAETEKQQAIDAALESVARYVESAKSIIPGHLMAARNEGLKDVSEFIRSRIGTNPLAEAQARIAELEDAITRMNSATIIRQRDDLLVQIEELTHQLAESECRNVSLASWQCPYTDGKSGLTSDEYGNQYCAKDRQLAETRKDAERYRWLCADLAGEERIKRNGILCRMPVMSYSAASTEIDAAMRQEGEYCIALWGRLS